MKIIERRFFKPRAAIFAAVIATISPAFCEPGLPPLPAVPLNNWVLAQPDWPDRFDGNALSFSNLNTAPGWGNEAGTALSVDTNDGAYLNLSATDAHGYPNINLNSGTINFWFQPNYTSVADGGLGPTNWANLFTIGRFTTNASASSWSLFIDPDGTNLIFLAQ